MIDLYKEYMKTVPPDNWGVKKYHNNHERVIAWQEYVSSSGGDTRPGPIGSRTPDYETWLIENGHTEEYERRLEEHKRNEIRIAAAVSSERERIRSMRKNERRVWGETATIRLTDDEKPKIASYLRLVMGAPSHRGIDGGMAWAKHGIVLGENHDSVSAKTVTSEHGKKIMGNIWKILEGE